MPIALLILFATISVFVSIVSILDYINYGKKVPVFIIIPLTSVFCAWSIISITSFYNSDKEFKGEVVCKELSDGTKKYCVAAIEGETVNINKAFGINLKDNQRIKIFGKANWSYGIYMMTPLEERHEIIPIPMRDDPNTISK